jgi:DNA-binding transcriptional ArsR family regulator
MRSAPPQVFDALGDPVRRAILELLTAGEQPAGTVVEGIRRRTQISQPAVSQHLRVLREAGLVDVRQDAQRRIYTLRPEALVEVDEWLGEYRRLWENRLDALHSEIARGRKARR